MKRPELGYATDFIDFVRRVLPELKDRGVRVLTNAGGLNPRSCRKKIFEVARELGVAGVRVGVVEGDDVLPRLPELVEAGHELANMDSGEPIAPLLDQFTSANAYLGARPVGVCQHEVEVGSEEREFVVPPVPDDHVGLRLGSLEDLGVVHAGVDDVAGLDVPLELLALLDRDLGLVEVGHRGEAL